MLLTNQSGPFHTPTIQLDQKGKGIIIYDEYTANNTQLCGSTVILH